MAKCRECGADIIFIGTSRGTLIPCDAKPVKFDESERGPSKVVRGNGKVVSGFISPTGSEVGYISHFSTCTNPGRFRRRPAK